jgi:hypothetical protein
LRIANHLHERIAMQQQLRRDAFDKRRRHDPPRHGEGASM